MHHRAPALTPPPTSANANTSASASLFCASATLSPVNHRATTGLPSQQPQPQPAASFLGELPRPNASSSSCFSSPPQSLRQSTTLPPLSPLNVNLGMSLNLPLPSSSSFYSPSSSTLTPPFEGAVQPSNNMSYPHFPVAPSSSRPLCSSTTAPTSLSSSRDGTSCSPATASSSGLLKGKTFYLDVTSASLRQQLCAQLCSLGATVHPFFSDAVSHMITDRHISSEEKRQIIQQNQQLAAGRSASSERSGVSPPLSPPSTSSSSSSYPCSSAANANEGCPSPLSSASFYPPTDRSNASDPESNESSLISQLRSLKKSHLSSSATTKRSCPRQQSTKTLSPSSSFCFPPSPSSCTSPISFPHHHLQRILNSSSLPLPSTNHNVVSAPSGLALIGLAYSLNKKIYHVNKFQPWLDKHCSELKSTTTAGFPHLQQHSQQRACNNKLQLQMPSQRCLQASSAPSSGVVPTSLLGADPISIIAGSPCLAPPPISIPIPVSMPHSSSTPNLLQNDTSQQRQRQQPQQHAGCASSLEQPSLRFPFDLRPKTKYIMVEDLEGAFKPICKHFTCDGSSGSEVPTLNFNAPKGCSPFTSSPSSSSVVDRRTTAITSTLNNNRSAPSVLLPSQTSPFLQNDNHFSATPTISSSVKRKRKKMDTTTTSKRKKRSINNGQTSTSSNNASSSRCPVVIVLDSEEEEQQESKKEAEQPTRRKRSRRIDSSKLPNSPSLPCFRLPPLVLSSAASSSSPSSFVSSTTPNNGGGQPWSLHLPPPIINV